MVFRPCGGRSRRSFHNLIANNFTNRLFMEDKVYDEWVTAPTRLVGHRVSIQWANLKFYDGKVTRYTTSTGMHTVKYDDGEEKTCDMNHKTFRIVSNVELLY